MPLEGHWARTHTPARSLGRREQRIVAAAAVLLAAAVIALAGVIVLAGGPAAPAPGCVDATIASTTGGAQFHACGDEARSFCANAASAPTRTGGEARAACRRAGL
jgi:hypothetical protein